MRCAQCYMDGTLKPGEVRICMHRRAGKSIAAAQARVIEAAKRESAAERRHDGSPETGDALDRARRERVSAVRALNDLEKGEDHE